MKKYSWAIPNEKSIKVLSNFSPLIELGCGKGYWSRLLQNKGIDITPVNNIKPKNPWTEVLYN